MKHSILIPLALVGGILTGCASDGARHDARGHYSTASDFHDGTRDEFIRSINDGLADFDRRYTELRTRSMTLNADARDEFFDHSVEIDAQRELVATRLHRLESALVDDWEDHRESVADAYEELREDLDDAQEDIEEEI